MRTLPRETVPIGWRRNPARKGGLTVPGRSSAGRPLLLIIFIVLGLVAGSLLSQLLRPYVPFLAKSVTVGFEPKRPFTLGDIFAFSLGFRLRFDAASLAGLIAGIWVYTRL